MNIFSEEFFRFDKLSLFIGGFVCLFSVLVALYSIKFMSGKKGLLRYYIYLLLTMIASLGVIFSDHLVLFIGFWGFLGLLLYLLIGHGSTDRTSYTAKKTFIIIGGTDAFMLFGLAVVWKISQTPLMSGVYIPLTSKLAVCAYLCLAAGAFAKAGAMPFHTWVPDAAEDAPVPVAAFLPASLDKLLGIYFLIRISLEMFKLTPAIYTMLMIVGSVTIIAAVMMALIQHDLKRLLGYHAVSQVGYMILGIGTATPIGIAGGLFHMLNNTIYKSALFFSGGIVENRSGTSDLRKLGGYVKLLPTAFITFLIASFAISGVPPFNGFVSKWMIYQGIIETGKNGNGLWILWLIAAMFGSALTLASFMKLVHAVFLGQPSQEAARVIKAKKKGSDILMLIPVVILAVLCIIFGVFARRIPLNLFIFPSLSSEVEFSGIWYPGWATLLLFLGLIVGGLIYYLGTVKKTREVGAFIGGEKIEDHPEMRVSGTEFYNNIQNIGVLKFFYNLAGKKVFDIYEVGTKMTLRFSKFLSYLHNGVLPSYLAWCLLGMTVLFFILVLR